MNMMTHNKYPHMTHNTYTYMASVKRSNAQYMVGKFFEILG